jgi:anti-sigma regulatory factor (Ser/Thr protein kinase)
MTAPRIGAAEAETPVEHEAWHDLAARTFAVGRLIRARFQIQTLEQADKLSCMLASQYPMPERVLTGIWELLANAVEHGNLEIAFEEKSKFMQSCCYPQEIARRLALPCFASRVVSVRFKRSMRSIRLRICDEGRGFDFSRYVDDPHPSEGPNGRGILIATKFSFDKVDYRGSGNIVDAVIRQ